jgi:hypothetical protein
MGTWHRGDEADVPAAMAADWIRAGAATSLGSVESEAPALEVAALEVAPETTTVPHVRRPSIPPPPVRRRGA